MMINQRISIALFTIGVVSSVSFVSKAQDSILTLEQSFIEDEIATADSRLGTSSKVAFYRKLLEKSLSKDLASRMTRRSQPYVIKNIKAVESYIQTERAKLKPDLNLEIATFEGMAPLALNITGIETFHGRDILRGHVLGFVLSKVELVVYDGHISGRISFGDSTNIMVIRSLSNGITEIFEVDASDVTYD